MKTVTSKDGTTIAFDEIGEGQPLILVTGAMGTRASHTELADALAPNFKVINYDRRGRVDSTDTLPYAVEREIEDIEALIDHAGGSASLYGISSGAILALEAANQLPNKVRKLVMYEPPFIINDSRPPIPSDYVEHLNELTAQERRSDAVEYFMTAAIGLPEEYLGPMKQSPMWAGMEKVAHTIAYDGTFVREFMVGQPLPTDRWTAATMPTLVMNGGESDTFFKDGALSLATILPNGTHRELAGQNHGVEAQALAPVLVEFFAD
jgi:pimeloyl-ACP methyl ester carboxylesterase